MLALSVEPGQLCHTFIPSLEILVESLMMNMTAVTDAVFQAVIGDPSTYDVQSNWYSIIFIRPKGFSFKGFHSGEQHFVQRKRLSPSFGSSPLLSLLYNLLNSITEWSGLLHFTELTSQDLRVLKSAKSDSYLLLSFGANKQSFLLLV